MRRMDGRNKNWATDSTELVERKHFFYLSLEVQCNPWLKPFIFYADSLNTI